MAAQDDPNGRRVLLGHCGDVQAELETGATPWDPHDPLAEASRRQGFTVRRSGEGDPCVRVQVVDVGLVDERMHGRVDRWRRAAFSMKTEVEGGDHFVFACRARVRPDERLQPVHTQHCKARLGKGAEVATRPFHEEQLGRRPCHRILDERLAGRIPTGIIGVLGVAAQTVGPFEQLLDRLRGRSPGWCHSPNRPTRPIPPRLARPWCARRNQTGRRRPGDRDRCPSPPSAQPAVGVRQC